MWCHPCGATVAELGRGRTSCSQPSAGPGVVDEPVATLGRDLKLPAFLKPHRREIEAALPPNDAIERAA